MAGDLDGTFSAHGMNTCLRVRAFCRYFGVRLGFAHLILDRLIAAGKRRQMKSSAGIIFLVNLNLASAPQCWVRAHSDSQKMVVLIKTLRVTLKSAQPTNTKG